MRLLILSCAFVCREGGLRVTVNRTRTEGWDGLVAPGEGRADQPHRCCYLTLWRERQLHFMEGVGKGILIARMLEEIRTPLICNFDKMKKSA